jgi:ribonuclease HII
MKKLKTKWLIGIDEAGRGPLAGPVAVGVFAIRRDVQYRILHKMRDSKKCSERLREKLFEGLKKQKSKKIFSYSVQFSDAKYIDKHGIVYAINSAMKKALIRLQIELDWMPEECEVFLDGSLSAPLDYINQKTIIRGDAKIPVISTASICAKVLRDREMIKLSKKYPVYKFEIHKGYGTLAHRMLIEKHGLSKHHRKTFCHSLLQ